MSANYARPGGSRVATRRAFSLGLLGVLVAAAPRTARATDRYVTRGIIKSFGKSRRYVNIAHDDIPGYMAAMTMAFHPARPEQLLGLEVGDRVEVAFVEQGDRRILESIRKV
ncbi:MAG: copper-binding protein [Myxococcales bacterium]|nr:copper-binding protein [Myxococcales bacterium]MBL0196677.1 copper-binding protein [Myxococcales bacterium]